MRAANDRFLCSGQVPVSTDVHKKHHRRAETPDRDFGGVSEPSPWEPEK